MYISFWYGIINSEMLKWEFISLSLIVCGSCFYLCSIMLVEVKIIFKFMNEVVSVWREEINL